MEVAQRRTRRVLQDLRLLGNCGNRAAYEYSDDDVDKIFSTVEREVEAARARFRREERKEVQFTLD